MSTPSKPATKTVKVVATIDGAIQFGFAKFLFALGTDGAWRMRITSLRNDGDRTARWTVCESPLETLGLISEQFSGDVSFRVSGDFAGVPGLGDFRACEVFACGDIGHRQRLPA